MSKIIVFGDIHIYSHKNSLQRLQDCLDALRWVLETARSKGIRTAIFLGDFFHDRQKIQVIAYHNAFDILKEYKDIEIKMLLGNHDLWFYDKWDISSVMPLSALPNVEVISKPCTLEVEGLSVDFIPFTHDPISIIKGFQKKSRILCSHLAIDGAILNARHNIKAEVSIESEKDVIRVTKDVLRGWEKVFLGHYHCAQKVSETVEYVGSPLQLDFSDAGQTKHIVVLDTRNLDCEYIANDFSPKHVVVKLEELDKAELDNNFVQIQVENVDSSDIIDIRKSVLDSAKVQTLEFKEIKQRTEKSGEVLQEKFDIAKGDVLDRWVQTVGIGDLEHSKLLQIGKNIINEN